MTHDSRNIILTRNYNLAGLVWESLQSGTAEKASPEALIDLTYNVGLKQIIVQPTRVTACSQYILDLTFLSDTILTAGLSWEVTEGIFDHKATKCSLSFPSVRNGRVKKKRIYGWDNADDVSVLDYLELSYPYFQLFSNDRTVSIDSLWIGFKAIVESCSSNYIPTEIKTVNNTNPWITREIIQLKCKLSRLLKLKNQYCLQRYKNDISKNSRTLKILVRKAKEKYMNATLGNFIKAPPN